MVWTDGAGRTVLNKRCWTASTEQAVLDGRCSAGAAGAQVQQRVLEQHDGTETAPHRTADEKFRRHRDGRRTG